MRRLKPQEKKRVGEFHLIRGVDVGLGIDPGRFYVRFMRHIKKLQRKLHFELKTAPFGRCHLRNLRAKRARVLARNRSTAIAG